MRVSSLICLFLLLTSTVSHATTVGDFYTGIQNQRSTCETLGNSTEKMIENVREIEGCDKDYLLEVKDCIERKQNQLLLSGQKDLKQIKEDIKRTERLRIQAWRPLVFYFNDYCRFEFPKD